MQRRIAAREPGSPFALAHSPTQPLKLRAASTRAPREAVPHLVLVVAMGRWVYAEIHSRTWLADFCGLAVDVVASGALAAPFLVTAGMRLLHLAHDYAAGDVYADASAGKVIAAEDW